MKTAAALVLLSTGLAAAATGGSVCAYIAPGCALLAPVNDACTRFSFDVCAKAPSSLVNWYYRTTMDAATKRASVKRFSDAACSKEEAQWAVSGGLGDCLGPIDKVVGIEAYIKFTSNSDTAPAPAPAVKPATKPAATALATKPGTQAAVSTVAAGPGRIETSAAVKPATTGAPAPSGTAGVVSVAAANTTSTAPTAQAPAAAQTTAKSAAARTSNSALAGLATLLACLLL